MYFRSIKKYIYIYILYAKSCSILLFVTFTGISKTRIAFQTKPIYYRAIRIKITGRTKKISSNTSHKRSRMLHISYARYRYKPRKSSAFENRRGRILRPYTSNIFDSRLSLESFIAAIVKSIGSYA